MWRVGVVEMAWRTEKGCIWARTRPLHPGTICTFPPTQYPALGLRRECPGGLGKLFAGSHSPEYPIPGSLGPENLSSNRLILLGTPLREPRYLNSWHMLVESLPFSKESGLHVLRSSPYWKPSRFLRAVSRRRGCVASVLGKVWVAPSKAG